MVKNNVFWLVLTSILLVVVVGGTIGYSRSQTADSSPTPPALVTPFGALWSALQKQKIEGKPFPQAEEVSLFQAQEKVPYPIPLPSAKKIAHVWIGSTAREEQVPPLAIQFEEDALLIISAGDRAEIIEGREAFPCRQVFVHGSPAIGCDCEEARTRKLAETGGGVVGCLYQRSVVWGSDGLTFILYSDTVLLQELLDLAETITIPPFAADDPRQRLAILRAGLVKYLQDGQIPASLQDQLLSAIRAGEEHLQDGDASAALQQLEAFTHTVQSQRGQMIAEAVADELLAQVQAIIAAITPPVDTTPGGT